MKKILALFSVFAFATSLTSYAQTYTFTAVSGTYTANTGATTIHAASVDDAVVGSLPIGFTFTFGCNNYTTFECSSNGWMGFVNSGSTETFNSLSTTTNRPKLAPLWDDLAVSSTGNVNYRLTGSAPNRVLTVEWKQMEWDYGASADVISFQCKLYETSNTIEFVYQQGGTAVSVNGASIGIAFSTAGSYYSLNGTGASPSVSSTTETTNLTTKPATGQIYRFTTGGACTGTPTAGTAIATTASTNCSSSTVDLSATGTTTGCGLTYQW